MRAKKKLMQKIKELPLFDVFVVKLKLLMHTKNCKKIVIEYSLDVAFKGNCTKVLRT